MLQDTLYLDKYIMNNKEVFMFYVYMMKNKKYVSLASFEKISAAYKYKKENNLVNVTVSQLDPPSFNYRHRSHLNKVETEDDLVVLLQEELVTLRAKIEKLEAIVEFILDKKR